MIHAKCPCQSPSNPSKRERPSRSLPSPALPCTVTVMVMVMGHGSCHGFSRTLACGIQRRDLSALGSFCPFIFTDTLRVVPIRSYLPTKHLPVAMPVTMQCNDWNSTFRPVFPSALWFSPLLRLNLLVSSSRASFPVPCNSKLLFRSRLIHGQGKKKIKK